MMNQKTFFETIDEAVDIPFVYQAHKELPSIPFIAYIGTGQDNILADNTIIYSKNRYKLEYYFTQKDEETERKLEQALIDLGCLYRKSEDIYIQSESMFVIYYDV